ncbi:MAG: hypothetical protein HYZ94_02085 [Candidatus Omnitrophica bacterium]|nr:hypothetical protein [Candidatus Omnitrophota bacterium]
MEQKIITFDNSLKIDILKAFSLDVDSEGYVVEGNNRTQRVLTPNGDPVRLEKFAGIQRGSLLFFEADLPSLIDLADRLK